MTVDFVTIKISPPCENRAGVEIIMVVLDWRHASPRSPSMKLRVGLNVVSHRGPDACDVPRSPRLTYRKDRKERQAEGTTRNPEHRLPWGFLFVAGQAD
jgi:hypothetical protein